MAFPATELAWMLVGPLATVVALGGAVRTAALLRSGERLRAYEARLGLFATAAMSVFVVGAASWVLGGAAGPAHLFAIGAIDVVAVVLIAGATAIAAAAATRATTR